MLQFTSRGIAGGISGNIDLNAWDGTRDELETLAGGRIEAEMTMPISNQAQWYNAANLVMCLMSMIPDATEMGPDGSTGTRHNVLADTLYEIRDAVQAAVPGAPSPGQWDTLVERVTAEMRVMVVSAVEQALQPIRQGLGEFGAQLGDAAGALDALDDIPTVTP
jgi:hypothetical protein